MLLCALLNKQRTLRAVLEVVKERSPTKLQSILLLGICWNESPLKNSTYSPGTYKRPREIWKLVRRSMRRLAHKAWHTGRKRFGLRAELTDTIDGIEIDEPTPFEGMTLLHIAVLQGDVGLVEYLIRMFQAL